MPFHVVLGNASTYAHGVTYVWKPYPYALYQPLVRPKRFTHRRERQCSIILPFHPPSSCQSRELIHACAQGNLRVEALFIHSLFTPGSTQMVHALSRTTTFHDLTPPSSLFTLISGMALCTSMGPLVFKSNISRLSIDPWFNPNGPLVVSYGRIFDLFIIPPPLLRSAEPLQQCSWDNLRLKALILGFLSTLGSTQSNHLSPRSVPFHILLPIPRHITLRFGTPCHHSSGLLGLEGPSITLSFQPLLTPVA